MSFAILGSGPNKPCTPATSCQGNRASMLMNLLALINTSHAVNTNCVFPRSVVSLVKSLMTHTQADSVEFMHTLLPHEHTVRSQFNIHAASTMPKHVVQVHFRPEPSCEAHSLCTEPLCWESSTNKGCGKLTRSLCNMSPRAMAFRTGMSLCSEC